METFRKIISTAFDIKDDQASYDEIRERIEGGAVIRGTNMFCLILAILIASVGLNMNSTAVIIGAMLISPLMGSIMAMGFGVATNDMDLFKKSAAGFILQVIMSLVTSMIYFKISPLDTAGSELLARTQPTIWDVIIATAGGFAGIIGTTRKEKSNVLPGVAIATALMPPLCTAGFGLANGNISYFLGALYLFFINTFFICVSTVIVTKLMHYPSKVYVDDKTKKKVKKRIIILTIITIIPSVFLALQIVQDSMINSNINKYISEQFQYDNTQVVQSKLDASKEQLEVAVIGSTLSDEEIERLTSKMSDYHLNNMTLKVTQTKVDKGITLEEVQDLVDNKVSASGTLEANATSEIDDLESEILSLETQILEYQTDDIDIANINKELIALYPTIESISVGNIECWDPTTNKNITVTMAIVYSDNIVEDEDMNSIKSWLVAKLGVEDVYIMQEDTDNKIDKILAQAKEKSETTTEETTTEATSNN